MPRLSLAHEMEAEIATNTERFSRAFAGGDGAAAAAVYATDALLLPPTGEVISGREAIERFWLSGIEIGLRVVELTPLGRGGAGRTLYEHGRYRMLFAQVDGRSKVERGPYVVVHVHADEDGLWHWAVSTFGGGAA